mmetsp:Transcript_124/g.299  ORF Transcript_124/g.299 Transcript_124/m.299 type:complete len:1410 (-) Transcript_124:1668-5897(-)|eukprot:CAMPEP_0114501910 /NCGR_PEP_ID=MMETSP0109-20121206/8760_1 /TAXON_ID=29199 /ORGANISM="Chlorarachnion reptans, Strain CCCM449" /LENGTH=1409 /DNA_ID=CAMNT_0001679691 /DNA_START=155 /DNA_END=4384 /DNA_ORIENTATION=+
MTAVSSVSRLPEVSPEDANVTGGASLLQISGWLWKKNQNFGWVKRYVSLNYQWLTYYEKPAHEFPLGFLNAQDILLVQPGSKNSSRRFDLVTNAHVYQFLAPDQPSFMNWLRTVMQVVEHANRLKHSWSIAKKNRVRGTPKWLKKFWSLDRQETNTQELKDASVFSFPTSMECKTVRESLFKEMISEKALMQKLITYCPDEFRVLSLLLEALLANTENSSMVSRPLSRRYSDLKNQRQRRQTRIQQFAGAFDGEDSKTSIKTGLKTSSENKDSSQTPRVRSLTLESPRRAKKDHRRNRSSMYRIGIGFPVQPINKVQALNAATFHAAIGKGTLLSHFSEDEKGKIWKWILGAKDLIQSVCQGIGSSDVQTRSLSYRVLYLVMSQTKYRGTDASTNRHLAHDFATVVAQLKRKVPSSMIKLALEAHATLYSMLLNSVYEWNDPGYLTNFFHASGTSCLQSSVWFALFANMYGSHLYPRLKFLKDVMYLLVNRKNNCKTLLEIGVWQSWLFPLLFDIPAEEGDMGGSATVVGKLRTYAMGTITVLHYHSVMNPDQYNLVEFSRQLRTSLALVLSVASSQSCELASTMLSAIISRFHTDMNNLIIERKSKEVEKSRQEREKETMLHRWQCLHHLVRLVLLFIFAKQPNTLSMGHAATDKIAKVVASYEQKRRVETRQRAATSLGRRTKVASKQSRSGSTEASKMSDGSKIDHMDTLRILGFSKGKLVHEEALIPNDRLLVHCLHVLHHSQSTTGEAMQSSWSDLSAASLKMKAKLIIEGTRNVRMTAEDMMEILKMRYDEVALANEAGTGDGYLHIPTENGKKSMSVIKLKPYGKSWKNKLKSHVELLSKLQSLMYNLKARQGRDLIKSSNVKKAMESVFGYMPFISDSIVFLQLVDSNLWPLLSLERMEEHVHAFCKSPDVHNRRKTFYYSQKMKAKDDKKTSTKLQRALDEEKKARESQYEILLVGPGQSGKSTIFKQLVHLHGRGFPKRERMNYRKIVYLNIVGSLKNLIYHAEQARARVDETIEYEDAEDILKAVQSNNQKETQESKQRIEVLQSYVKKKRKIQELEQLKKTQLSAAESEVDAIANAMETMRTITSLRLELKKEEERVLQSISGLTKSLYDVYEFPDDLKDYVALIKGQSSRELDMHMGDSLHRAIVKVWNSVPIQEIYKRKAGFKVAQVDDSCQYFLKNIDRILPVVRLGNRVYMDSYTPTLEDVLNCRQRTRGVVEGSFDIETKSGNQIFRVVDVAGQRGARRKWIPFFRSCDCVLFVLSLAGYNRFLLEQSDVRRLEEAVALFSDIVNQASLRNTPFIIFLNKSDLFEKELATVDLSVCFSSYKKPTGVKQGSREHMIHGVKYIIGKLKRRINQTHRTDFYFHVTCATDTNQVNKIFSSVTDIIIQRGLASAGLL